MSAKRTSRADLQQLATRLSKRDMEVIHFVQQHRFATTVQLRRHFFISHTNQAAATRACIRVLDRLLGLRILTRLERRIGGVRHGSSSYVWCLDIVGDRLLRTEDGTRRRFREPSFPFLAHTLQVTETVVQLYEAASGDTFSIDTVEVETEAWRTYVGPGGAKTILKPDLFVTVGNDIYDDHWYIEVDMGTESLPVLIRKCAAYEAYRRTGRPQAEHGVMPRVLWILPDTSRVERLKAAITGDPVLPTGMFACITNHDLVPTLSNPPQG